MNFKTFLEAAENEVMEGFASFFESDDYRSTHLAPNKDDAPLHDLTKLYPDDIYTLPLATAARYYGHGSPEDIQALSIMRSAKDRPSMPVKIYRAVPDLNKAIDEKIKEYGKLIFYVEKYGFAPMSDKLAMELWVETGRNKEAFVKALNEKIEKLQSERKKLLTINSGDWVTTIRSYAVDHGKSVLLGNYKIVSKTVKAKDLYTDANSPYEFGYNP